MEVKHIEDKCASTIAQFLYEIICQDRCLKIQIKSQGRESVDEASKVLPNMIGPEQHITLVCHPQSNGLFEQQNRINQRLISLVNGLDGNLCD